MSTQTEAERLADILENTDKVVSMSADISVLDLAAELRRQASFINDLKAEILEQCRINGMSAEREAIMDEWWMCVQSDLENGVKSLNERAAEKWKKEYPAIAGFAATIEARGNA